MKCEVTSIVIDNYCLQTSMWWLVFGTCIKNMPVLSMTRMRIMKYIHTFDAIITFSVTII